MDFNTAPPNNATEAEKAVFVAATWWALALVDPEFDNGDGSWTSLAAGTFAKMAAAASPVTYETASKFRDVLVERLNYMHTMGHFYITLSVDYHPCPLLGYVLHQAGLESSMTSLPWKTDMWLNLEDPDSAKVEVGKGYKSDLKQLWPLTEVQNAISVGPNLGEG